MEENLGGRYRLFGCKATAAVPAMKLRGASAAPAFLTIIMSAVLASCGGSGSPAPSAVDTTAAPQAFACDDTLKAAFKPDANTTVILAKSFKAGEPIVLANTPSTPAPPTAPHDLCVVKMVVGPGNPGPADAPSTTTGIGVEVWLPSGSVWDKRLQLVGTQGTGGLPTIKDPGVVGSVPAMTRAIVNKTVSAQTDHGHLEGFSASDLMNPDGSINTQGWANVSDAAVHEMAVKVKALVKGFYSQPQAYSYLMGCSGGGKDGYESAEKHPGDFDGILAGSPALNWMQVLGGADMYPQIVYQRDLGGTSLTASQRSLVSAAAVSACDAALNGQHDGYIADPQQCRYDPTKDKSVLCVASGGTNSTSSCLTTTQATAVNKMWYGLTTDGTVPDPAVDIGQGAFTAPDQLWFGPTRGTDLAMVAGGPSDPPFVGPFAIWMGPLIMQDSRYGIGPGPFQFKNATGNGQNLWKTFSYSQYADMFYRGLTMLPLFANINVGPDLTAFQKSGGKLLSWHGTADNAIPFGGSVNYYERSAAITGGFQETRKFHRFFPVPGVAHCAGFATNGITGVSPAAADKVPYFMTDPSGLGGTLAPEDWFDALKDWVEKGKAPDSMQLVSQDKSNSRPACPYPKKLTFLGGPTNAAASYTCN